MLRWLAAVVVVFVAGCRAHSNVSPEVAPPPPAPAAEEPSSGSVTDADLVRVQKRALYLVEAEQGRGRARDLLRERKDLAPERTRVSFTVPRGNAWYAVFGHSDAEGAFVPVHAYRAPIEFSGEMEDFPVGQLPEGLGALGRAVTTACERVRQAHGREQLDPVVLEEADGITVYVLQGFEGSSLYLLGGDFRFRFSPDGRQVLQEQALHQTLIPVSSVPDPDDEGPPFSAHAHVLVPGPLETEWAVLMLHPDLGGLFVGAPAEDLVYALSSDGTLRVVRLSREEILRELRPDGTFAPPESLRPAPEGGADVER
jgi:hypothetical protein